MITAETIVALWVDIRDKLLNQYPDNRINRWASNELDEVATQLTVAAIRSNR